MHETNKQYAEQEDTSPPLNKKDTKIIQEVVDTFLYYGRTVDCMGLVALGSLTTQHANPTENTMEKVR